MSETSSLKSGDLIRDKQFTTWAGIILGTLVLIYSYGNSLLLVTREWELPEYSHGYLIPLFAIGLLWMRKQPFTDFPAWHRWVGIGLITLGTLIRVYATQNVYFTVDYISFIPSLLGVFVLFGGLGVLSWAGLPIVFLIFMFPLPGFLRENLLNELQKFATQTSVYMLQTLGVEVYQEGNIIHLEQMKMNVVDACSGLRMLTIFCALAIAIAMIVHTRPWWERLIIVASAIPIALAVNVIRITTTGLLYNMNFSSEVANWVFHDFAGYIMMPMALAFLGLELKILSNLFIEVDTETVRPIHG